MVSFSGYTVVSGTKFSILYNTTVTFNNTTMTNTVPIFKIQWHVYRHTS